MENERDIIVVGAGPAGAATATALAQMGHDVLLLDRHQFPRDKTCGDAVPTGAIQLLSKLGMGEKIRRAEAQGEFYPLYEMLIVSPKGHVLEADFTKGKNGEDSYVAPRIYFDAMIQQHAIDSGAEFSQVHVKEPIIEGDHVVGVRARINGEAKEFRAKVVVGADGVTSAIARSLRPKSEQHRNNHRAVALRSYVEGIEELPNKIEFYFFKEILPGYAWIFPTGKNQANVGLGMRLDFFRQLNRPLEVMLDQFLELPDIKKRLLPDVKLRDTATWQLSFGSQQHLQYVFDGALLVGDAAGFINPLTGGGIHNALISAQLAAKTINEAFERGDFSLQAMQIYQQRCHDALWDSMKRSYRLQRWLMRFPFLVDFLVKWMDHNSEFARTFLTKV